MQQKLNKDIEDIRAIHQKCLAVITSCKTFEQILSASTYFKLAIKQWDTKYPLYSKQHQLILGSVKKHIDIFLTLRRRQMRHR